MRIAGRLAGQVLRLAGPARFRGKGRVVRYWMNRRDTTFVGRRRLAGGASVMCDFSVPYEAMIWSRQEEELELRWLAARLRPGDHFIDCGAGLGLWTLTAAAHVGETGLVTAFEPNDVAFVRLQANLAASPALAGRVRALAVAVGDRCDDVFVESSMPYNIARIVERAAAGARRVPMVTLDSRLPSDQPVHGIKIDVEGFEHRVLLGARGIIERWRPWIWAELNVEITGAPRLADWDVFKSLGGLGYRCSRPAASYRGFEPADDQALTGYVNCLFEPR